MEATIDFARRAPGRSLMWFGVIAALLGIAAYAIQFSAQHLFTPWYMPGLATLGVVLVAMSLVQARTGWRIFALLLVMLLAGAEWMLLLGLRLPPYAGPVTIGKPMPAFTTLRADGAPFTQNDLPGAQNSVLVFFRGRW
jgi:hypothetical protein